MERAEKIVEVLENLTTDKIIEVHNQYVVSIGEEEKKIEYMGTFNEYFCDYTPWQIAEIIQDCEFNAFHEYFQYDGVQSIETTDYPRDFMDLEDMADWIIESDEDFDISYLREILDSEEED